MILSTFTLMPNESLMLDLYSFEIKPYNFQID